MQSAPASSRWLVPALVGVLVGVVAAGGPLWYYAGQLQSRLDAKGAAAVQLQSQLAKAQADKAQLQAEKAELQTNQRNLEANTQQLAKPDLPLELNFRHIPFTDVVALFVRNASDSPITVFAQVTSAGQESRPVRLIFPPNREVHAGGWKFGAGDGVTLVNPSYRPKSATLRG